MMNKIIEKTKTKKYYVGTFRKEEVPVFMTTDKSEFEDKNDAIKHQNYLDEKAKEYIDAQNDMIKFYRENKNGNI